MGAEGIAGRPSSSMIAAHGVIGIALVVAVAAQVRFVLGFVGVFGTQTCLTAGRAGGGRIFRQNHDMTGAGGGAGAGARAGVGWASTTGTGTGIGTGK